MGKPLVACALLTALMVIRSVRGQGVQRAVPPVVRQPVMILVAIIAPKAQHHVWAAKETIAQMVLFVEAIIAVTLTVDMR